MRKLIFEKETPSGDVLIDLRELGILRWLHYITNRTFHKDGVYEQLVSEIEENNQDKILVVINDNSNHGYVKRCYMCVYTEDELKS
jgi:hypothetical protein